MRGEGRWGKGVDEMRGKDSVGKGSGGKSREGWRG